MLCGVLMLGLSKFSPNFFIFFTLCFPLENVSSGNVGARWYIRPPWEVEYWPTKSLHELFAGEISWISKLIISKIFLWQCNCWSDIINYNMMITHSCYQRPFHCMDQAQYRVKNSAFEGVPVWVLWVFLVPKVYFGVRTMCKKFHKVGSLRCDLARITILRFSLSPCNAVTAVWHNFGIFTENFWMSCFHYNIWYSIRKFPGFH